MQSLKGTGYGLDFEVKEMTLLCSLFSRRPYTTKSLRNLMPRGDARKLPRAANFPRNRKQEILLSCRIVGYIPFPSIYVLEISVRLSFKASLYFVIVGVAAQDNEDSRYRLNDLRSTWGNDASTLCNKTFKAKS